MVVGVSPGGYRGGDGLCFGAGLGVQSEVCGGGRGGQHQHHTERRKDSSAPGWDRNPEEFHPFQMIPVSYLFCLVLRSGGDRERLWLRLGFGP